MFVVLAAGLFAFSNPGYDPKRLIRFT